MPYKNLMNNIFSQNLKYTLSENVFLTCILSHLFIFYETPDGRVQT